MMRLVLDNRNNDFEEDFVIYLIKQIEIALRGNFEPLKTIVLEEYINTTQKYASIFKKYISVKDIIFQASRSIVYSFYGDLIVITISYTELVPNTFIKLSELCRLINYGTTGVRGYPIFSKTFKHFEDNVYTYLKKYKRGM